MIIPWKHNNVVCISQKVSQNVVHNWMHDHVSFYNMVINSANEIVYHSVLSIVIWDIKLLLISAFVAILYIILLLMR